MPETTSREAAQHPWCYGGAIHYPTVLDVFASHPDDELVQSHLDFVRRASVASAGTETVIRILFAMKQMGWIEPDLCKNEVDSLGAWVDELSIVSLPPKEET